MKALITLYQRPHVTEICFEGLKRLEKFGVEPICIYSDIDNKVLVEQYGFEGYFYQNKPISNKLNFGIERALESEWDYLMQIGSDDLLHDDLFDVYAPYIECGSLAFGLTTMYYYDLATGKCAMGKSSYPFGCARMIHRSVFDRQFKYKVRFKNSVAGADFHYGKGAEILVTERQLKTYVTSGLADIIDKVDVTTTLWSEGKNRALDYDSDISMLKMGIKTERIESNDVLCIDLKSEVNIWPFEFYDVIEENIIDKFPERDAIRKVRQEYYNPAVLGN